MSFRTSLCYVTTWAIDSGCFHPIEIVMLDEHPAEYTDQKGHLSEKFRTMQAQCTLNTISDFTLLNDPKYTEAFLFTLLPLKHCGCKGKQKKGSTFFAESDFSNGAF